MIHQPPTLAEEIHEIFQEAENRAMELIANRTESTLRKKCKTVGCKRQIYTKKSGLCQKCYMRDYVRKKKYSEDIF